MTMHARVGSIVMAALLLACSGDPKAKPKASGEVRTEAADSESSAAEGPAVSDAELHNGQPSLEALGKAVVAALASKDGRALTALTITEREFEQRLFGSLVTDPKARRPGPGPAWKNLWSESMAGMTKALAEHGGKDYEFVSLESTQQESRPGLVLHRNPKLTVQDASGKHELKILGEVIEHPASGTFAILSFTP